MFAQRAAAERGRGDHGWLRSLHTFSFGEYYDPQHMGFRVLRVMNEDHVAPGRGFGTHPHRDMEIVTYVLSGALAHKDSLGHEATLRPGEFQRISAGTGVEHSEFNPSATESAHFYQIWLLPRARNLPPSYEQKSFMAEERQSNLRLVASPHGRDGSLTIQQDVQIWLASLDKGGELSHEIDANRHAWLQVLRGNCNAGGLQLEAGDGLAIGGEPAVAIRATNACEVMLFDLP